MTVFAVELDFLVQCSSRVCSEDGKFLCEPKLQIFALGWHNAVCAIAFHLMLGSSPTYFFCQTAFESWWDFFYDGIKSFDYGCRSKL